jgi:hypothetical protein
LKSRGLGNGSLVVSAARAASPAVNIRAKASPATTKHAVIERNLLIRLGLALVLAAMKASPY